MFGIPGLIGTLLDLLVVILGFGLIVFLHECGHFFAARWAGIRVLGFAVGFGPAIASYRKGLGWRRGSTEPEYRTILLKGDPSELESVSPTEYRLNYLPLGGYVKMLGQDDLDPTAVSEEPDSYQNCKPWKRMIVISAGVVTNVVTAAMLFVVVFMLGLKVEPPRIGMVAPGPPAAEATPLDEGNTQIGLQPGDEVVTINGRAPNTFADVRVEAAMASANSSVQLTIQRPGQLELLRYEALPEVSRSDGLLSLGVDAPSSLTVSEAVGPGGEAMPDAWGLQGVGPGSVLTSINGQPVTQGHQLTQAFQQSQGQPVELVFQTDAGVVTRTLTPSPELNIGFIPGTEKNARIAIEHLLGLLPVMMVARGEGTVTEDGQASGLQPGDIFAAIDGVEFPSLDAGIRTIQSNRSRTIKVIVLREVDGELARVPLDAHVSRQGRIGFSSDTTASVGTVVALPPTVIESIETGETNPPAATKLVSVPGERIIAVNGQPVTSFTDIRNAIVAATTQAFEEGTGASINMLVERPLIGSDQPQAERVWDLDAEDIKTVHQLAWTPPFAASLVFEPEQIVLRAEGPLEAIGLGLSETRRVLVMTYVTFARLFQQTVKIEHLKGPVGIAQIGTILAGRGFVWVLFFMAVISVNLAVINFLPLPIVDGGQFLMLLYEQIRGKPLPVPVQNAVTMAGLLLIVSLFLVITFNDVRNLFGL